jgi:hypothetical protein
MSEQSSVYYDEANDTWIVVLIGAFADMNDTFRAELHDFVLAQPRRVEFTVYDASADSACSEVSKAWEQHHLPLIKSPIIRWRTVDSPAEFLKCCSLPVIQEILEEAAIQLLRAPHEIKVLDLWIRRPETLNSLIHAVREETVLRSYAHLATRDIEVSEKNIRDVFALGGRVVVVTDVATKKLHSLYRRVVMDVVGERGYMLEFHFYAYRPKQPRPSAAPRARGVVSRTTGAIRVPPPRRVLPEDSVYGLYERAMRNWQSNKDAYRRALASSSLVQRGYVRQPTSPEAIALERAGITVRPSAAETATNKLAREGLAILRFFRWSDSEDAAAEARFVMNAQRTRMLDE